MKNQENLEGIISKLKEQGINKGQQEREEIIEAANKEADFIICEANAKSQEIIDKANSQALQIEKNATDALKQASRDLIEATKIAITKNLKEVFGSQCKSLMTQEEYLTELLKVVLEMIPGDKDVAVSPELSQKMQAFIADSSLKAGIKINPLERSEAKIEVKCDDNDGIQFVLTSEDIENGLFSLLNKDLVERIRNNVER